MKGIPSFNNKIVYLFLFLAFGQLTAQDEDDSNGTDEETINTERLIIVKPYSPTVSDAFKIKQTPVINDSTERKKKEVNYDIYSFPVASTFTPAKGKAAGVDKKSQPHLYENYAALGLGNYTNIMAEFFGNVNLDRDKDLAISLMHNSSQGGIDEVVLDNHYYDTDFGLDYMASTQTFSWEANLGVQHQVHNWYGIPEYSMPEEEVLSEIEPQQSYYAVSLGANINMFEGLFNDASFQYRRFGDSFSSGENHILLQPNFQFPVGEELIHTNLSVDFVNGKFDDFPTETSEELTYGFLNMGVQPGIQITREDLSVELGAQLIYSIDTENDENNFYVYPKISGSYRLAGEYFILFAGAEGGLQQNTYYDFAQENPFVQPGLAIAPTDKQYDIYAGGKGKFTENLGYTLRGSYRAEKNKALFQTTQPAVTEQPASENSYEPYQYGNSFFTVYDAVNTASVFGEVNAEVNEKLSLKANATYYNYNTDTEQEAWNIPNFEASIVADYHITEKWAANAQLFFVGERKSLAYEPDQVVGNLTWESSSTTLDAFVDANLSTTYKLNDRLSVFVKGNNLFANNYERWHAYPVQGIQIMGGASYQFDW